MSGPVSNPRYFYSKVLSGLMQVSSMDHIYFPFLHVMNETCVLPNPSMSCKAGKVGAVVMVSLDSVFTGAKVLELSIQHHILLAINSMG